MSHIVLFILIYPMISVSHIQFHIPIPMCFTSTTRHLFLYYLYVFSIYLSIFDFYVLSMSSFPNFALFKRFNIMNINLQFNYGEQADTAFTKYRWSRTPLISLLITLSIPLFISLFWPTFINYFMQ